jgi:hypothetical protein
MAMRNHSKRPAWAAERMEKQVRKRLGITRHDYTIVIHGVQMVGFVESPVTVRERFIKVPQGRSYHFAVKRFTMVDAQGCHWTALQAQAHDAHHGFALSVTGFYGLKSVSIPVLPK